MEILIGSDHRGFALKEYLKAQCAGVIWRDVGAYDDQRSDYPVFAARVCEGILAKKARFGVLICGSGVGVTIAANRYKGIYAALCWDFEQPREAYEHDNINVLALSSDLLDGEQNLIILEAMIDAWKSSSFQGGRYQKRIEMLDSIENK